VERVHSDRFHRMVILRSFMNGNSAVDFLNCNSHPAISTSQNGLDKLIFPSIH